MLNEVENSVFSRMYGAYQYPAFRSRVCCHQEANKLRGNSIYDALSSEQPGRQTKDEQINMCFCCYKVILEELPLDYPTSFEKGEKSQLSFGLIMYFLFIKMSIGFLLLRLLIFDIYSLYASTLGKYCEQLIAQGSTDLCVVTTSIYNLKAAENQEQLNVMAVLSFVSTVILITFCVIYRKMISQLKSEYEENAPF
jgi:hypothetical protein